MNREQAKKLLPIIQAFAGGADVQAQYGNGSWHDIPDPYFDACDIYRIKPKPFERWCVVDRDNDIRTSQWYDDRQIALDAMNELVTEYGPCRVVRVREVIE